MPPGRRYDLLVDGLSERYHRSSAWCFSRDGRNPADEYITESEDYCGLAAGSFGYVDGVFYANTFSIGEYVRLVGEGEFPVIARRRFLRSERVRYHFLMKLFAGHLDPREAGREFGFLPLVTLWKEALMMAATGGIRPTCGSPHLTERGRFLSTLMMREFFSAVSEFRESCRAFSSADEVSRKSHQFFAP